MGFGIVGTHSNHGRIGGTEAGQVFLKTTSFDGAAAGEITGIEVEHQPFALEVGQIQPSRYGFTIGCWRNAG